MTNVGDCGSRRSFDVTGDDGSCVAGLGCLHAPHSGITMHWNPDMGLGSYGAIEL